MNISVKNWMYLAHKGDAMDASEVEIEKAHINRALRKHGGFMSRQEIGRAINVDPAWEVFREALGQMIEAGHVIQSLRCTSETLQEYVTVYKQEGRV